MAQAKMTLQLALNALSLHLSRAFNDELGEQHHGAVSRSHKKNVGFSHDSLRAVCLVNRASRLRLMVAYIIGCPFPL